MPFWVSGKAKTKVEYRSNPTRLFSGDMYLGGAQGEETFPVPKANPTTETRNLELIFRSGVNRTDLPTCYGSPSVDKKLGNVRIMVANDIISWKRLRGDPV